jgi:hypothetical protein
MSEDMIFKGREKMRRQLKELRQLHENASHPDGHTDYAAPGHALSEGFVAEMHDQAKPDCDKSAPQVAGPAERARGGNSVSVEDFDASRSGTSSRRIAVNHPDLRQSSTDASTVIARLRTARGNTVDLGISDSTPGGFSHAGEVALHLFDAAGDAGSFAGMMPVSGDPSRPAAHRAATGSSSNGSHSSSSQQAACSTPHDSMKASDRLAIIKAAMYGE